MIKITLSMHTIFAFIKQHKIIAGGIGILLVGIILVPRLLSASPQNAYTVKRENIVNTVLINGTYSIASQTQVTSPTNGIITKLFIDNGSDVIKGASLFHVESSATPDQQKTARANYLAAQSTFASDNAMLYTLQSTMYATWKTFTDLATNSTYQNSNGSPDTTSRVLPEFTTAQDDWLAAEANYKNQQSVLAKDQAAVSAALQAYNETQSVTVTAPIAGKVINLASKMYDQVSAPSTAQPVVPPVLMIADLRNPVLVSAVDQVNIPKLHVGQNASIVFDALPDQTFSGTIDSIDIAGVKTQGTVNFNVYITIPDVPASIKPNMTASITIETARKNNILTIPNDAIIQQNGKSYVRLVGSQQNNLIPVVLGLKGLTKTEVISGISEGDQVLEQQ